MKKKGPQREESVYFVCMDDPIHPDDMEQYEALRLAESEGRNTPPGKVVRREAPYRLQNETDRERREAPALQNETIPLQSETDLFQIATDINKENPFPLNTETTAALPPANRRPPEGEESEATRSIERPQNQRGLALIKAALAAKQRQSPSP